MGRLNFNDCEFFYNKNLITLERNESRISINYDFNTSTELNAILKMFLNTSFIQNLILNFKSDKELFLLLEIRKGEQNFVDRNISFNMNTTKLVPITELNPYTSSIYFVIPNNKTKGKIIIEKL